MIKRKFLEFRRFFNESKDVFQNKFQNLIESYIQLKKIKKKDRDREIS